MRSFLVAIWIFSLTTFLNGQTNWTESSSSDLKRWQSPNKTFTFFIQEKDSESPVFEMFVQRNQEKPIKVKSVESELRREHMGHGWFPGAKYKWLDERFLIFYHDSGVGVLDVDKARFLINNSFASLEKHPTEDKWIFVRYRGEYRHGGWDPKDLKEKLGVLELTNDVLKPENPSTSFLDHCKWTELSSLIVSPPIWTKDGSEIAFLQWINGKTYQCLHNGKTLKENKKMEVQVDVPKEILESPALVDDLKPKLESLIK